MISYKQLTEGLTGIPLLIKNLEILQEIYEDDDDYAKALTTDFVGIDIKTVNEKFAESLGYLLQEDC